MKKIFLILYLIVFFVSCEEESPKPVYINPFEGLEIKEYVLDTRNKLLLYNGNNHSLEDGTLTLGADEFGINTTDGLN